eukprot:1136292-Pelagomonas_calceolata.AAC.3
MLFYIPVVQAPPPPKVVWVQLLPIKLPGREELHPGQLAAEAAAGRVGEAVRAEDACLDEVANAPEKFVDPTCTATAVKPQLPAEERGAGEGAQAHGSKLLHKARGAGAGRGE